MTVTLSKETLKPIKNNVVFAFLEGTSGGKFEATTSSGLIVSSILNEQASVPRWGRVISVGPDVKDIVPGSYVLVEPGKWTHQLQFEDGEKFWKTDDKCVIAVSSELPSYN